MSTGGATASTRGAGADRRRRPEHGGRGDGGEPVACAGRRCRPELGGGSTVSTRAIWGGRQRRPDPWGRVDGVDPGGLGGSTASTRARRAGRRRRAEHCAQGRWQRCESRGRAGCGRRPGSRGGSPGGDPEAGGWGDRGSGDHLPQEIGLEAFEVWRVLWVTTSTRLEARGFDPSGRPTPFLHFQAFQVSAPF